MKKILIPLLVLVLICIGLAAAAEENEAIRLEVNTRKLQVYDRGTAMAAELTGGTAQEEDLPVLVIPVKKTCQMQVTVTPKTLKNKKVTLGEHPADDCQRAGSGSEGAIPCGGDPAGETYLRDRIPEERRGGRNNNPDA